MCAERVRYMWGVGDSSDSSVACGVGCQMSRAPPRSPQARFLAHHDAEDEVGLAQAQLSTLSPIGAWTVSGVGGV